MCGFFKDVFDQFDGHSKRFQSFADDLTGFGKGKGINSYSDFVNIANTYTDGWYGTVADSLPVAGNLHRSVLNRDRANDMLRNSGQSWGDVIGYNSSNLTSGTSAPLGQLIKPTKIEKGVHDLYKFYTGD